MLVVTAGIAGGKYGGGAGTAEDPYLIVTPDHMDDVAQYAADWDKHFKLMADLDMSLCSNPERAIIGEYLFTVPSAVELDVQGGKIYYSDWSKHIICRANLDGTYRQKVITGPSSQGFALDLVNGKIYWTDVEADNIKRANLDGTGIEDLVVADLVAPGGIDLDVSGGKMYWVDRGNDTLKRANLDGTAVETLVSSTPGPMDVTVVLSLGKVYWTDTLGGAIRRANLDGSAVEFVMWGLGYPWGIAADEDSGKLYWSAYNGIHRADLDGSNKVLLITPGEAGMVDLAVDANGGKMYWPENDTDNFYDTVSRANLDGSGLEVLLRNYFIGVLDGNGHTIHNFTLSTTGKDGIGLFDVLDGADSAVKNLGVIEPIIQAGTGERVGALIGRMYAGQVQNCYVKGGSVSGTGLIGGLTGTAGGDCNIINCYAQTTVTGDTYVGGLMGLDFGASLSRCYAASVVDGNTYPGGLVGGVPSPAFADCFWDVDLSGQSASDGGVGKTTAQMQTRATFEDAGWDFTTWVWAICEGTSYPYLWYETVVCQPKYGGGSGTPQDPYLIYTAEQMSKIGEHPEDWDKHFKLMSDLDLSAYTGSEFPVITTDWQDPFTGVFDGNEHVISNFTYVFDGFVNYLGLFGCVGPNGRIRDLGLVDPCVSVTSGNGAGTVAGLLFGGAIERCWAKHVQVTGCFRSGGLVGEVYQGQLIDSYADGGNVFGTHNHVGGLVGENADQIIRCYSTCHVDGDSGPLGGLVARNSGGNVTASFWDKDTSTRTWSDGGTGKTTAHMMTESTFTAVGWDFVGENANGSDDVWRMCLDGADYPKLWWQFADGDFLCPDGVDLFDYSYFSGAWGDLDCHNSNHCARRDLDFSGTVDERDLRILCEHWLAGFGD
jgi:hypothetical protein